MLPSSAAHLLFWLAAITCTVAQIAIVRAALAGRTPGASATPLARLREFFWVLLPALLLALLLGGTWSRLRERPPERAGVSVARVDTGYAPPQAPSTP